MFLLETRKITRKQKTTKMWLNLRASQAEIKNKKKGPIKKGSDSIALLQLKVKVAHKRSVLKDESPKPQKVCQLDGDRP